MGLFLITFVVMLLVVAGMAVGVMNGRKAISGSCGGLNAGGKCAFCTGEVSKCKNKNGEQTVEFLKK